jgi:hypothetical protein
MFKSSSFRGNDCRFRDKQSTGNRGSLSIIFLDVGQNYTVDVVSLASTWGKDDAVLKLRRSHLDGLKELRLGHCDAIPESLARQYIGNSRQF